MSLAVKYIQKELCRLSAAGNVDILVAPHEDGDQQNILKLRAVIMGSPDTAYGYGMFHFDITITEQYPQQPPMVHITTTNKGLTRFNPNLSTQSNPAFKHTNQLPMVDGITLQYATGHVCLSIINTWSGANYERWSATNNIYCLLRSIQSVMNTRPYCNEPGYAGEVREYVHKQYNNKIKHETIRIAVCGVMETVLDAKKFTCTNDSWPFRYTLKSWFLFNYDIYLDIISTARQDSLCADGSSFVRAPFEGIGNQMAGAYNYTQILQRLGVIYRTLVAEEKDWIAEGVKNTSHYLSSIRGLQNDVIGVKEPMPQGIHASHDVSNVYSWNATINGCIGDYKGGSFSLKLVFSKNFPMELPRVRFTRPVFHPQVTPTDYTPRLRIYMPSDGKPMTIRRILVEIQTMLRTPPTPDPILLVNPRATRLCFSNNRADRQQYKIEVEKCARASQGGP